jgi:hypothetical protein
MKRNLTKVEILPAYIVQEPVAGTFDVVIVSHILEYLESPGVSLSPRLCWEQCWNRYSVW